jgi:hypothetical protein
VLGPDGAALEVTPAVRRRPPDGTLLECAACGARWPLFADKAGDVAVPAPRIVETAVVVDEDPQPAIPFDNRGGTAPYAVTRTFTAQWQQTWEIVGERSRQQRAAIGVPGIAGMTLEMVAERAIRAEYSISETTRVTRSDEVSFEVPPGVRREVRIVHRRVWHHGTVRVDRPEGDIDIPFRVLTDVEIGYQFDDSPAPG